MKEINIIHLSDLHIDDEFRWSDNPNMGTLLDDALCDMNMRISPDYLLVTGDFTNKGSSFEFDEAERIIENMLSYDSFKNIKGLLMVPGNHDFPWYNDGKKLSQDKRKKPYLNFVDRMCKKNPVRATTKSKKIPGKLKGELQKYLIDHLFITDLDDVNILLLGMNSMMIDSEKHAGIGLFTSEQFKVVKKLISFYSEMESTKPIVKMAAFHHHIVPVSALEREYLSDDKACSITLDARRAINFFLENEIRFVFHGHQHQPSIVNWSDGMSDCGNCISILSAGSVSADPRHLNEIARNSFMVYKISNTRLSVCHFAAPPTDRDRFALDDTVKYTVGLTKSNVESKEATKEREMLGELVSALVRVTGEAREKIENEPMKHLLDLVDAKDKVTGKLLKIREQGILHVYDNQDIAIAQVGLAEFWNNCSERKVRILAIRGMSFVNRGRGWADVVFCNKTRRREGGLIEFLLGREENHEMIANRYDAYLESVNDVSEHIEKYREEMEQVQTCIVQKWVDHPCEIYHHNETDLPFRMIFLGNHLFLSFFLKHVKMKDAPVIMVEKESPLYIACEQYYNRVRQNAILKLSTIESPLCDE